MIISSIFELCALSATQLSELLGENAGKVHSVNVVARKLPEAGKRVLWVSRTSDIEVGSYSEEHHRVALLSNLGFGEESLLRAISAFHFWIEVEYPDVFRHSTNKIETSTLHHKDPVVLKVREEFFDLFSRLMQYIGPYNEPPENRKILLVDCSSNYHLGFYHKHNDKPSTVTLCDTNLSLAAEHFAMWADVQFNETEYLLKCALPVR